MNIKPEKIVKESCFYCGGLLEFLINETIVEKGIKYKCNRCRLIYTIQKYD